MARGVVSIVAERGARPSGGAARERLTRIRPPRGDTPAHDTHTHFLQGWGAERSGAAPKAIGVKCGKATCCALTVQVM